MTIKELRQMKGLTLAAFAESIGIGMSTLTGYEAGKRQPGAKALAAIKEVYGVDLNSAASPATPVEAAPVKPEEEKAVEKKAAKKPRAKKQAAPAKETPTKKPAQIIIQSPMGGEITPEDILTKAGNAEKIYVRVDQNKLYIVNGDETSSVDLW